MSLELDELRAQLTRHCRLLGLVLATRFCNNLQLSDLLLANVDLHLQFSNLKLQSLISDKPHKTVVCVSASSLTWECKPSIFTFKAAISLLSAAV